MSQNIKHKNRVRTEQEQGASYHSWHDGRYRVALIYPNTYHQGMSNLGFQSVYHLINQRQDCLCERFFLPDPDEASKALVSVESERPLSDFDLIALSISFENDYLNLPIIFELAGIPLFADQRQSQHPLVLLGGVCAFLNPEPLAEIVDLVAVGEAEPLLDALLDGLQHAADSRDDQLLSLARLPGIYVPRFYHPEYSSSGVTYVVRQGIPTKVRRQYLAQLDEFPSRNFIQTDQTEFGHMALTEVSRGCTRGCRFCAAGYIYLPFRERSLDNLLHQVDQGLCSRKRIGLVAAAVADYSQFAKLQQGIIARQGEISISSLRLDAIDAAGVALLQRAGHSTVAIAPEVGSQKLRNLINKGFNEQQILSAVELLAAGGIKHLKLYFLIGLPCEDQSDIEAIVRLTRNISELWRSAGVKKGQLGMLTVSVNPFIPKPFTPLQWAGMDEEKTLKKKGRFLQAAIAKMPNTRFLMESVRKAVLQGFLARGDRRVGRLLPEIAGGGNLRQICTRAGYPLVDALSRQRSENESFPWEIIDQGVRRSYLWEEYRKACCQQLTQSCFPGCQRCGICNETC